MKKKLSVRALTDISKANDNSPVEVVYSTANGDVQFTVKRLLSFQEASNFIVGCVYGCFDDDHYYAELRDFAFLKNLLMAYTDCNLPEDEEKQYALLFSLPDDFYAKIYSEIDQTQFETLKNSVEEQIQFQKERLLHKSKWDEVADSLQKAINSISDNLTPENMENITRLAQTTKAADMRTLAHSIIDIRNGEK